MHTYNIRMWVTALALVGCSDSGPTDEPLPRPGRYRYTFDGRNPSFDSLHYDGTLVLTSVTLDSMKGSWDVPGYNTGLLAGDRTTDYWFLMVGAPGEGLASHRVFPGEETLPVECDMSFLEGSGVVTLAAECTLERE